MRKQNYILFIASWYPNEDDPTLGIFIRRHAEAVALYTPVKVLYVRRGEENQVRSKKDGNIEEFLVTYKPGKIAQLNYFKSMINVVTGIFSDNLPSLIHAHVVKPAGVAARFIGEKFKIPYLITEHWTGYHPSDGSYSGFLTKLMTRHAVEKAAMITTVSEDLKKAMLSYKLRAEYHVIPNVADPIYFNEPIRKPSKKFVHISSLDERQKNISGIIRAFSKYQKADQSAELVIAGDGPDREKAKSLASELQIRKIKFPGNLNAFQLASELSDASALVLFSNFENLPCVIIEAFATGVPVIATNVGGIREIVNESNGILLNAGDELRLEESFRIMSENTFDRKKIREQARAHFSYEVVGKQFMDLYKSIEQK